MLTHKNVVNQKNYVNYTVIKREKQTKSTVFVHTLSCDTFYFCFSFRSKFQCEWVGQVYCGAFFWLNRNYWMRERTNRTIVDVEKQTTKTYQQYKKNNETLSSGCIWKALPMDFA